MTTVTRCRMAVALVLGIVSTTSASAANNIDLVLGGSTSNINGTTPFASTDDSASLGVDLINNGWDTAANLSISTTKSGQNNQPGNLQLSTELAALTALAASADIALVDASAAANQADQIPWSLQKTGQLSGNTVNWTITATPGAPQPGALVISGQMTVVNRGGAPATIGNIVVNLQVRSGRRWLTIVSDIADATHGDAATTALVMPQASSERRDQFTESGASGELQFTDATNNTVFSLVPQVLILAGETRTLLFQASFDNIMLAIPAGTPVRAETIVSFGNATAKGNSVANLDINGNGTVDADEVSVRSVPSRLTVAVPAATPADGTVALSDTIDDITTTGSVTFANATFNLGATGGTVSVTYDAGADGGTITNCAYLTGTGVDLEACDTQTIDEPTTGCTPGAAGCGWLPGDMLTHPQFSWVTGSGLQVLEARYNAVYAASFGVLEIGLAGAAGFSLEFSGFAAVSDFLPTAGPAGALNADLANPTSSSAGVFGGELLALRLNVDFADAGYIGGAANVAFGDLTLCGLAVAGLDGLSVRELLDIANTQLGGGLTGYALADIAPLTGLLNSAFGGGGVSTFAQQHLYTGACPEGRWEDGDMLTYGQGFWSANQTANDLLRANYDAVYASTGSVLRVGFPTPGFSLIFTSAQAVLDYVPSVGPAGALDMNLINPTVFTSSGSFGGGVVALKLDIDFSDAGVLQGSAGLLFGDLTLCNFPALPALEGVTIREFLTIANTALGGGTSIYGLAEIAPITQELSVAFGAGGVSAFAQQHLVAGACPP